MNRIAIFASGTGSNALKIIEYFKDSSEIEVGLIISNKSDAGVLDIAKDFQIPFILISRDSFYKSHQLIDQLMQRKIHRIVLAGFLWLIPQYLIQAFPNKIVNIHPALLPKYGGKGMYGHHVHQAVHDNRETESGITIHLVNEKYDEGKIIFQKLCVLTEEDTPKTIQKKVQVLEHTYFPQVIEQWILGETKGGS